MGAPGLGGYFLPTVHVLPELWSPQTLPLASPSPLQPILGDCHWPWRFCPCLLVLGPYSDPPICSSARSSGSSLSPSFTSCRLGLLPSFQLQTLDPVRLLTLWPQPSTCANASCYPSSRQPQFSAKLSGFSSSLQPNSSFICQVLVLVNSPHSSSQTVPSSAEPWPNHPSVQLLFPVHASLIFILQSAVSCILSLPSSCPSALCPHPHQSSAPVLCPVSPKPPAPVP